MQLGFDVVDFRQQPPNDLLFVPSDVNIDTLQPLLRFQLHLLSEVVLGAGILLLLCLEVCVALTPVLLHLLCSLLLGLLEPLRLLWGREREREGEGEKERGREGERERSGKERGEREGLISCDWLVLTHTDSVVMAIFILHGVGQVM